MNIETTSTPDDEIDLVELLAALFSQWFVIGITTLLLSVTAVYYSVSIAVPKYEASAKFLINQGSTTSSLAGLSSLASFAGISVPQSADDAATFPDRIASREFIVRISAAAELESDPEFNPPMDQMSVVARVLVALGIRQPPIYSREAELDQIITNFRERVTFASPKSGAHEIKTSHPVPERASEITNAVLAQLLEDLRQRKLDETQLTTEYMRVGLQRVQADLDAAAQALSDFAIENDALSREDLVKNAATISALREEQSTLEDYMTSLSALALETSSAEFDAETFVMSHPDARDVFFRRLLGLSAAISSWQVPDPEKLSEAQINLSRQIEDLSAQIGRLENTARLNASAVQEMLVLERDLKVQQAVYERVVQQFETQAFSGGFEPPLSEVIERAVPPLRPASPNTLLNVALGCLLGLILGSAIGLLRATRAGIAFTSNVLTQELAIDVSGRNARRLEPIIGNSYKSIWRKIQARRASDLDEIAVSNEQTGAAITLVVPTARKWSSICVGLYQAGCYADAGHRTAFVDFSRSADMSKPSTPDLPAEFRLEDLVDGVSIVRPEDHLKVMTAAQTVAKLASSFDRLIIALPHVKDGAALAAAIMRDAGSVIIIARPGRTLRSQLWRLRNLLRQFPNVRASLVLE